MHIRSEWRGMLTVHQKMGALRQSYGHPNRPRSKTCLHVCSAPFLLSHRTASQELMPLLYCSCSAVYFLQLCPTWRCLDCHVLENICSWTLSLKLSMSVQERREQLKYLRWNPGVCSHGHHLGTAVPWRVVGRVMLLIIIAVFFPRYCEEQFRVRSG